LSYNLGFHLSTDEDTGGPKRRERVLREVSEGKRKPFVFDETFGRLPGETFEEQMRRESEELKNEIKEEWARNVTKEKVGKVFGEVDLKWQGAKELKGAARRLGRLNREAAFVKEAGLTEKEDLTGGRGGTLNCKIYSRLLSRQSRIVPLREIQTILMIVQVHNYNVYSAIILDVFLVNF
jgi:hypothetical protein